MPLAYVPYTGRQAMHTYSLGASGTLTTHHQRDQTRRSGWDEAGRAYFNVKAWLTGAGMTSLTSNTEGIWMASLLRGTGTGGPGLCGMGSGGCPPGC